MKTYLETAKTPGTAEKLMALLAVCCATLFMGGLESCFHGGVNVWREWVQFPLWSITILLPLVYYMWVRKRPVRAFSRDIRAWFLALMGSTGVVLAVRSGRWERWDLEPLAAIFIICSSMAGCFLWHARRREAALAAAERQNWRLSAKDTQALSWELALEKEMSPRQRRIHVLVLGLISLVFFGSLGLWVLVSMAGPGHTDPEYLHFSLSCYAGGIVSFIGLYVYLSRLLRRELVERKVGEMELQTARRMQMALLPGEAPRVEGLDVAGMSIPAMEVGGDLFDYFHPKGREGALGIVMADVSGKAMQAAVAAVLLSGALRTEYPRAESPADILNNVHAGLCGALGPNAFIAAQVLVLQAAGRAAAYANAGQLHPLLLRKGNVSPLTGGSLPLGLPDGDTCCDADISLDAGDILILFTDGITEAMNGRRELYGFERLGKALQNLPPSTTARQILDILLSDVRAFSASAPQNDDMTLVVARII